MAGTVGRGQSGQGTVRYGRRGWVRFDADNAGVYMPIVSVIEDAELRKQMLDRARRELHQWRNRYHDLAEFSKVFTAIDDVIRSLTP